MTETAQVKFCSIGPSIGTNTENRAIALPGDKMLIPVLIQGFFGDVLPQMSGRVSKSNEKFKD
ncbi:hypothetical protein [Laspinema palackyanum]|uniref:hypothetical protein n=1 Tax=Laspinema palackyanum TaxID=3231601 RepID=UPI00345CB075|nr:hypothetical protein [Laspinema sp. D2c]